MTIENDVASQSNEEVEIERDTDTEALFADFGMSNTAEKKDVEFPTMPTDGDPATDQPTGEQLEDDTKPTDSKKYKVKYNKEDVEVDESQVPELIEKGMNLDKVRSQKTEVERSLDRVAKLQGYKDHAELTADLDRLEQMQHKQKEDEFQNLRNSMIEEYREAGGDVEELERYLDSHPFIEKARQAVEQSQAMVKQSTETQKWGQLYDSFPDLKAQFRADGTAEWYTPDMEALIQKGYEPVHAYKLIHGDTIQASVKKQTEQNIIKQQQLGTRMQIDQGMQQPEEGSISPAQRSLASEFGVDIKGVQKHAELIKNRR